MIKSNKILTIVVPSYNVEKYIDRCLASLTHDARLLKDLDVIIVNDGSLDGTALKAQEYASRFKESVRIIDKDNGGHGSTINAAIPLARGKFFRVVDADDWVNIDDFSKYIDVLKNTSADLVLTDYSYERVYDPLNIEKAQYKTLQYNVVYKVSKFNFQDFLPDYFTMATMTYKTEVLLASKLYLDEKTYYVDMEYAIFPLTQVKTFIYLDFEIYRYYIGRPEQSMSKGSMIKHRADHRKVLEQTVAFYKKLPAKSPIREYVATLIKFMIYTHFNIYMESPRGLLKGVDVRRELASFDGFINKNARQIRDEVYSEAIYIRSHKATSFMFVGNRLGFISKLFLTTYYLKKFILKEKKEKK